jgi:hypothetical protein
MAEYGGLAVLQDTQDTRDALSSVGQRLLRSNEHDLSCSGGPVVLTAIMTWAALTG